MRTIICRFENKKSLEEFNSLNKYPLDRNVKEVNLLTGEVKTKKPGKTKGTIEKWKENWFDMPEYISEKQEPYAKIDFIVGDMDSETLSEFFDQSITGKTKSIWFPKLIQGKNAKLRVLGPTYTPKYPIYIVSKGRARNCYTSKYLSLMETEHYVVVEPDEVDEYIEHLDNEYAKVLMLDMSYKDRYDTFDDLGDTKSKGPGPARNFCWEHSIANGDLWHWVMDDNANEGFHYMNNNAKQKVRTGAIFRACENFVDRYDNIGIAGMNYSKFCKESDKTPAFVMNTRIYSFLLIRNDIPYRWRGRYNEDTDLSLRVLKDGLCTVQFNAFLAGKATTQKIKGGNTDEFYQDEGTLPKSEMLQKMHPDVAEVVWKFSRWHHQVDYSGFKQELQLKDGVKRVGGVNNFGMFVIDTEETINNDSKSYLEEKYFAKGE